MQMTLLTPQNTFVWQGKINVNPLIEYKELENILYSFVAVPNIRNASFTQPM